MRFSILVLLTLLTFSNPARAETAYDRVIRTGVIRCGYYVFPPIVYRDINTGAMSGFSVDMMNRLAERAGLKVEWTEEITFGNWVPALQSNRFDVACTPMWPEVTMGKAVLFTKPLFFSALSPAARADNPKFAMETRLADLNKPDLTVGTQEGNATARIVRAVFPQANVYAMPPESDTGSYYQSVMTGKADFVLTDRNGIFEFNKANPGAGLRLLDATHPLKVQSFPLAVNRGEAELRDFLNLAIDEMNYSGEIDAILRKWESEPGLTYLRVAKPYDLPSP